MSRFKKIMFILFGALLVGAWLFANASAIAASPANAADIRIPTLENDASTQIGASKKGDRISLNFTNIKVRELLQLLGQFSNVNFVVDNSVMGEMSIHLRDVPWTQALDVILKSQNLGERRVDNVIYVAPVDRLLKQRIDAMQADQKIGELVPLVDKIIHLNYANGVDVQKLLESKNSSLLSSRGVTSVDTRTNSIWVHDTPAHTESVAKLLHELDYPVKQVMIEARIVSIRKRFERHLGARFGLSKPSHITGTLTGANSMAGGTALSSVTLADRLNFDSRASGTIFGTQGNPGSIGFALSQVGPFFVDMEISALEEQNDLNVISSPRLITSNQQKAYIQTGEEIPYQSATSSGATSIEFKDAVLKLEVTPQITPDNRIMLNLKISNNRAGDPIALNGSGTAIPIITEEEESNVLLNDQQTVVLGGVYKLTKGNIVRRIPFLGKIPLIGNLFRNTNKNSDDNELIIFLTPHIIHKPSNLSAED